MYDGDDNGEDKKNSESVKDTIEYKAMYEFLNIMKFLINNKGDKLDPREKKRLKNFFKYSSLLHKGTGNYDEEKNKTDNELVAFYHAGAKTLITVLSSKVLCAVFGPKITQAMYTIRRVGQYLEIPDSRIDRELQWAQENFNNSDEEGSLIGNMMRDNFTNGGVDMMNDVNMMSNVMQGLGIPVDLLNDNLKKLFSGVEELVKKGTKKLSEQIEAYNQQNNDIDEHVNSFYYSDFDSQTKKNLEEDPLSEIIANLSKTDEETKKDIKNPTEVIYMDDLDIDKVKEQDLILTAREPITSKNDPSDNIEQENIGNSSGAGMKFDWDVKENLPNKNRVVGSGNKLLDERLLQETTDAFLYRRQQQEWTEDPQFSRIPQWYDNFNLSVRVVRRRRILTNAENEYLKNRPAEGLTDKQRKKHLEKVRENYIFTPPKEASFIDKLNIIDNEIQEIGKKIKKLEQKRDEFLELNKSGKDEGIIKAIRHGYPYKRACKREKEIERCYNEIRVRYEQIDEIWRIETKIALFCIQDKNKPFYENGLNCYENLFRVETENQQINDYKWLLGSEWFSYCINKLKSKDSGLTSLEKEDYIKKITLYGDFMIQYIAENRNKLSQYSEADKKIDIANLDQYYKIFLARINHQHAKELLKQDLQNKNDKVNNFSQKVFWYLQSAGSCEKISTGLEKMRLSLLLDLCITAGNLTKESNMVFKKLVKMNAGNSNIVLSYLDTLSLEKDKKNELLVDMIDFCQNQLTLNEEINDALKEKFKLFAQENNQQVTRTTCNSTDEGNNGKSDINKEKIVDIETVLSDGTISLQRVRAKVRNTKIVTIKINKKAILCKYLMKKNIMKGDFVAALKYGQELSKITVSNSKLKRKLQFLQLMIYVQKRDYEGLIKECSIGLQKKPDDLLLLNFRARAYLAQQKLSMATKDFKKILQKNPKDFDALTSYANILTSRGEYFKARKYFKNASKSLSKNLNNKYRLYYFKKIEQQIQKLNKAIANKIIIEIKNGIFSCIDLGLQYMQQNILENEKITREIYSRIPVNNNWNSYQTTFTGRSEQRLDINTLFKQTNVDSRRSTSLLYRANSGANKINKSLISRSTLIKDLSNKKKNNSKDFSHMSTSCERFKNIINNF